MAEGTSRKSPTKDPVVEAARKLSAEQKILGSLREKEAKLRQSLKEVEGKIADQEKAVTDARAEFDKASGTFTPEK